MLSPEQERNKQQVYNMIKERKKRLSETDKRSLIRAVNGLTDFGNDFANYRSEFLSEVPNTVITGLCQVLKEAGFAVYLPREADRYNEISTLCLQETWNTCLHSIFEAAHFISLTHAPSIQPVSDSRSLSEIYLEALSMLKDESSNSEITTFLRERETARITHIVFVNSPLLKIIATFEKRGSAHRLLSYAIKKGEDTSFFDMRTKLSERNVNKLATKRKSHPKTTNIPEPIIVDQTSLIKPVKPLVLPLLQPTRHVQPLLVQPLSNNFVADFPQDNFFVVPTKKNSHLLPPIKGLMSFDPLSQPFYKMPSILTQII